MEITFLFLMFLFSFGLTFWVRRFALKKDIIDIPNERSSHSIPTPRGGGLAIVLSFYFALIILYYWGQLDNHIFYGLLGIASIAIIGFIDDHEHIPARYRLFVHFGAAFWACYWLGIIPWGGGDNLLMTTILWGGSLFYLVWMLNLYNFMDGIDGIATVEALTVVSSATLLLFLNNHHMNLELMLILIVSLIGFLFWNWPPAKIFMGDVGSAFLGILVASFSLITANDGSLSFVIWLILLAVFITDATYTLFIRFFRGEKVYEAHRSHAYQILSRRFGHKLVTVGVLITNVFWLLPLAWLGLHYEQLLVFWFCLAYLPLIFLAIKSRAGQAE